MTSYDRNENLARLRSDEFDVLIIGGGIFGAVTLWQAQKRGLRAALLESHDYGHGSSANSYKIIHGGIRYLQHLDLPRLFASARERSAFIRIAPHMCYPLPILIPTYGWAKLGLPFLGIGCLLYDLLTFNRNRGIADSTRKIPFTRFLSKRAVLKEFPDIPAEKLTGGCVFNDGRFHNPTRLVWSFCASAIAEGAVACNYAAAEKLSRDGKVVTGVLATDRLTGKQFNIRAKTVVNAAGPWAERWMQSATETENTPAADNKAFHVYSRDACFVIDKINSSKYTLALQGGTSDPDAVISREKRHLFVSPWREYTLVGVWHKVTEEHPERLTVSSAELEAFLEEINQAYPALNATLDDIRAVNCGLVPFGEEQKSSENLSYGKRSSIIDHAETDNLENVVTLIGLRYTMARAEGVKVLNIIQRKLGQNPTDLKTDFMPLQSAKFSTYSELLNSIKDRIADQLSAQVCEAMARNHGSDALQIIDLIKNSPKLARVYKGTSVTAAEIIYTCQCEQIETLADVMLRRTDIATAGHPGEEAIREVLNDVAKIKNWDSARQAQELQNIEQLLIVKESELGQATSVVKLA